MCGIAGFYGDGNRSLLKKMSTIMEHRGPDDKGFFLDKNIGLVNNRLSIIDLKDGHQPISNEDDTIHIIFNGEIYNYLELREALKNKGHKFKTNSDTEVIIHLYEEHYLDCVNYLRGMFAFAIWDSNKKQLLLARDRLGIKPLYYTEYKDIFMFSSEIKAILKYETLPRKVSLEAFRYYILLKYVPQPLTLFQDIYKLPAGHLLIKSKNKNEIKKFWDIKIEDKKFNYAEEIDKLLKESTKLRLISEVPLGSFLSGGIDSTAISYFMTRLLNEPLKTFSVGFEDDRYNELKYSDIAAKFLLADHHKLIIKSNILDILPFIVWHLDEPIADSAILPTFALSKYAKRYVTVILTGEGADELFGGYEYYKMIKKRKLLTSLIPLINKKLIPKDLNKYYNFLKSSKKPIENYSKYHLTFYENELKCLLNENIYNKIKNLTNINQLFLDYKQTTSNLNQLLYYDLKLSLPENLLMKIDKTTMAHSLEARVPFLDHKLVELAFQIPFKSKINYNGDKLVLRKLMKDKIPKEIVYREKHGFTAPRSQWLNEKNIKNLLIYHLENIYTKNKNYFDPNYVKKIISNNKPQASQQIWNILIFEIWYKIYIENNNPNKPTIHLHKFLEPY